MMPTRADWMDRFAQLAETPALAQPRKTPRIQTILNVATIALGLYSYFYKSRIALVMTCFTGVFSFYYKYRSLKRRVEPKSFDLSGIAEGLNALTKFKQDAIHRTFASLLVRVNDAEAVAQKALTQCNLRFNGMQTKIDALDQLGLTQNTIWNTEEAQNYRTVLPSARRFIATYIPYSESDEFTEIYDAAFRFVYGHEDKNNLDKGYVSLAIREDSGCRFIEPKKWFHFVRTDD